MEELIKITTKEDGTRVVSAKDLHAFLEVGTERILWFKRMMEYGFDEDKDFVVIKSENPINKQVAISDYALSLDCAKEISMIQRTDKGKKARIYFLEMEKIAHGKIAPVKAMTPAKMFLQQAQAMVDMEAKIDAIEEKVKLLEAKTITHPTDYYTIAGYASLLRQNFDINKAADFGRKASKMCNQMGYVTGTIPDPRFGRVKTYPVDVLKSIFES